MPVIEWLSRTRSSFQCASTGKNTTIALLLAVFFNLHLLAGAILRSAAPIGAAPVPEEAKSSLYD